MMKCAISSVLVLFDGDFGSWAESPTYCPNDGYSTGFEIMLEDCGCDDNTAVNSIKFTCSGGSDIQSDPGLWGSFSLPQSCPGGYTRAQARILPDTVSKIPIDEFNYNT